MKRNRPLAGAKPGTVSLERAFSKLGLGSRTQAREWIESGRVRVDGVLRRNPSFRVVPERVRLEVDGKPVAKATHVTYLLYKPRGVVTTRSDEKGRPTVFSLLKDVLIPLHAVGRLDMATTGLLLLTNDTRLSSWLTEPANKVPRVYLVTVRGEMLDERVQKLCKGVRDEGELLRVDRVEVRKRSKRETHLAVELAEGKNRELRRLFKALGHEVTRLKRVSFGELTLGELSPGEYRELSLAELQKAFPRYFGLLE